MTLQLDARQRAMLEEMGIRLFWPEAPAVAAPAVRTAVESRASPVPVQTQPRLQPQRAVPPRAATPATPPGDTAALGWDELQAAVQAWADARHRPAVFGTGDLRPDWLCVGDPPIEEEELGTAPFAGEPGRLLDNMLAAVGASRQRGAYLTHVSKCRLPPDRGQEEAELAEGLTFLRRQVELLQPRLLLAMGRFAVHGLLASGEPLGKLRGRVHEWHGVPLVVTYHPAYLLRNPADKAKAWADLCLAQSLLRVDA